MESSATESDGLDAATYRHHPIRHGIGWLLGVAASALILLLAYVVYAVVTSDNEEPFAALVISLLAVVTFIVSTAAVGLIWYGAEGSRGRWGKRLRITALVAPAALVAWIVVRNTVGCLVLQC